MSKPTVDVRKLRKNLWYIIPMFFAMVVLCGWMTWDLTTLLKDIATRAPFVRLWPGAAIGPIGLVFFGSAISLAALRGAAYEGDLTSTLDKVLLYSGLALVALLALLLVASSVIQNTVMLPRGYTQCALLQGNPSMWFTDWIQNPAWCERGKDSAWVLEQARAPRP